MAQDRSNGNLRPKKKKSKRDETGEETRDTALTDNKEKSLVKNFWSKFSRRVLWAVTGIVICVLVIWFLEKMAVPFVVMNIPLLKNVFILKIIGILIALPIIYISQKILLPGFKETDESKDVIKGAVAVICVALFFSVSNYVASEDWKKSSSSQIEQNQATVEDFKLYPPRENSYPFEMKKGDITDHFIHTTAKWKLSSDNNQFELVCRSGKVVRIWDGEANAMNIGEFKIRAVADTLVFLDVGNI